MSDNTLWEAVERLHEMASACDPEEAQGVAGIIEASTDAAIAAAREAGREEQRALDAEAHGEVVARLVTAANRYLGISYTPPSVQCLDIANEFIAAVGQFATQPTTEEADAL